MSVQEAIAKQVGNEELRTIYEEMEQVGNSSAKLPESTIVNFCTYVVDTCISLRKAFWAQLTFYLVQKAVAILCSAKAGDSVCLILFKLKLIVKSYLFA